MKSVEIVYRRPGRSDTTFVETLAQDGAAAKVTLLEHYEGQPILIGDAVVLEPGAPIVWFVFPGAWHDVGRFHRADGTFTGWYTNLCTPVVFGPDGWIITDLFLDLWTPPSGPSRWLDEDEFADAVERKLLDDPTRRRALEEQKAIDARMAQGDWPPQIARDVDLAEARRLLASL